MQNAHDRFPVVPPPPTRGIFGRIGDWLGGGPTHDTQISVGLAALASAVRIYSVNDSVGPAALIKAEEKELLYVSLLQRIRRARLGRPSAVPPSIPATEHKRSYVVGQSPTKDDMRTEINSLDAGLGYTKDINAMLDACRFL